MFSSAADFLASPWASLANCLILDVQMPGMGGLDLYGWYRQHGHSAPVIFITAHEDAETEARAAEAGAMGFFYKPFHSERLWQAVEKALHVAATPRG